jgi:hypothetical protein
MAVYELNPLEDPRWEDLLQRDSRASVFHTRGWLGALQRTYGYEPVVFTTSAPREDLENGIVFCHVSSWLTGRRLVSLPFSDHCEPLVTSTEELPEIMWHLTRELKRRRLKYIEVRPLSWSGPSLDCVCESEQYLFHTLDIEPPLEELFRRCHNTSIRQRVQRAKREALTYMEGNTPAVLKQFYHLFVTTRRKHGLPPSPFTWFSNLATCFNDALQVRIACIGNRQIAGILTIQHGSTLTYKYSGSDASMNKFGAMPALLWSTIAQAKDAGLKRLDMGRSDLKNEGLVNFKDNFGGARSALTYWRAPRTAAKATQDKGVGVAGKLFTAMPDIVRVGAGRLLYRHVG